jgi:hypothetical protein
MAKYSNSMRVTTLSSGSATWAVLSPANHEPAVMELSIINAASVNAHVIGIGRSSNVPTFNYSESFGPSDEARVGRSLAKVGNSFLQAPSAPAQFFRRASLASAIGFGIAYCFTRGIILPAGGTALVIWCIAASATTPLDVHCSISE